MPLLTSIAPGISRWTARHPEWHPSWGREVASFALDLPGVLALVDPLAPADGDAFWQELDLLVERADEVSIFITIPYHTRSSADIHARYADRVPVRIHGHRAVSRRLPRQVPLEPLDQGAELPAGARTVQIGNPRRQEQPVYFPSHKALAFGDTIVGVDGVLRVWQSVESERRKAWYRDRFLPSLEPLLELDVEHVLVTHGLPVVGGGSRSLAQALAREPWTFRSSAE
jgi:hypothetical protein